MEQSKGIGYCINIMSLSGLLFSSMNLYSQQLPQPDNFIDKISYGWDFQQWAWSPDTLFWTQGIIEDGERIKELDFLPGQGMQWWHTFSRYRYITDGLLDSIIQYSIDTTNNVEIPDQKNNYSYQDGKMIKSEQFDWISFQWKYNYRRTWELDGQGRYKNQVVYEWYNAALVPMDSNVYYYGATGLLDSTVSYEMDSGSWTVYLREHYAYDSQSREVLYASYWNQSGPFEPFYKVRSVYLGASTIPDSVVYQNWTGMDWQNSYLELYESDLSGKVNKYSNGLYDSGEWKIDNYDSYTYDNQDRLYTHETHFIDSDGEDYGGIREVYNYGELSSVAALEQSRIRVFPIPATNEVTFLPSALELITSIRIYDMNGRLIEDWVPLENHVRLDVSEWPDGAYIYRIQTSGEKLQTGLLLHH